MTELVNRQWVVASSLQPLGTVRLGAAVAKGAAPIDLTDFAALQSALIKAKSVGIADPSGGQNAMDAVAAQEIEIAMG